jgi:hypothetical protein
MTNEGENKSESINKEKYENEFKLDDFLEENYPLLGVLGIFGAISIYLNQISNSVSGNTTANTTVTTSESITLINIGVLSSLFLFVLVGFIVNKKIVLEYIGRVEKPTDVFMLVEPEGLTLTLFAIPFNILIYVVTVSSTDFSQFGTVFWSIVILVISISAGVKIQEIIMFELLDDHLPDRPLAMFLLILPAIILVAIFVVLYWILKNADQNLNLISAMEGESILAYLLSIGYGGFISQIYVLLVFVGIIIHVMKSEPN